MASKIGSIIQLLLAVSIFYLGYAIYAMTAKIDKVVESYPQVLQDVQVLSETLHVDQWLEVAETLEGLVPRVIKSVEDVTAAVNDTNKTAASIDQKIPAIVKEASQYRQHVIAPIVDEAKYYRRDVLPKVLLESQGYRQQTIPQLISESQALRQDIPPILTKADALAIKTEQIMDKSQEIAKQATQGAVKGVILSPIDLIREAGNEIKGRVVSEE